MDFNGTFDFQLFLYRQVGWPKEAVKKESIEERGKLFDFLENLRKHELLGRLCIDIGDAVTASFDGIEYNGDQLTMGCSLGSDYDNLQRLSMVPEKLEILVYKDPRLSYLALSPEDIMDIDGLPQRRKKCVLVYPDSSLFKIKQYRASMLANHGLGELSFEEKPVPDAYSLGYLEAIVKRIQSDVFPRLRRQYGDKVSSYGLSIERASPEEFSRGKVRTTSDEIAIAFYMDVTKKMQERDVEDLIEKFFIGTLPYDVCALATRMAPERMSVRLLANVPE